MNTLNPSRYLAARPRASGFLALLLLAGWPALSVTQAADLAAANAPAAIPWNEIGAKVGANYQGDGLAVMPTESGAHLHCIFQRLDGEATAEGLWLTSTVTNTVNDRFRVTAIELGRSTSSIPLSESGEVSVCGQTARFSRPGLTEEYSVSMDGVRQDFIVQQAPPSPPGGELMLKLAVDGAQVEAAADGARLVLANSGREIAYSRLRVTDATGKQLPARIEVCPVGDEVTSLNFSDLIGNNFEECSPLSSAPTTGMLAVVVNDTDAVYPVRIDPTFSDANWVSMGGFPGANGTVHAAVIDGSGNLYIGGYFSVVGNALANNVAQWNGSNWSALGSGMGGVGGEGPAVFALAVSGSTVYAGGLFTTAGGSAANYVAKWNGTSWSALGSGMNDQVNVLAVSGSTLYAGGYFTTAGGVAASGIAHWNGSSWSALGSGMTGMNNDVWALAMSGSTLYAGGQFTTAGGVAAGGIAQWNGSSWSPLALGMNGFNSYVNALAVSGSTVYAGGNFTTAGNTNANYIAQWNGSSWSALGSGIDGVVSALAVSGSTLYAGGGFTNAGGNPANDIAQWNGSNWSSLGSGFSGMDSYREGPDVTALAVSGSTLYAGGQFTTAGSDTNANCIAQWNGSSWSALGSGMNGGVFALVVSGGALYAGGEFTQAGTNVSAYAALAYLPGSLAIITNAAFGVTNGLFGFSVSGPSGASVIIQASTDLQTWIPLETNLLGSGPLYFSDPQSPANVQRFYRAQLSP